MKNSLILRFTFHSGSSQTAKATITAFELRHLHSTLVLLKLILFYTLFAYKSPLHSTLVLLKPLFSSNISQHSPHLHSTLVLLKQEHFLTEHCTFLQFTFHSGSSQTQKRLFTRDSMKGIYIPLWFFSNDDTI